MRARRDRGFSLLIVLMLGAVMAGVAATVILSTRRDLSVAGQDRETLQAFYAAEYGVAQARDLLAGELAASGITEASFTGWSPILATMVTRPEGCATARRPMTTLEGGARFTFCVHNDADDVAYLDPSATCAGDVCDDRDPRHVVTIEAWGATATAQAHLAVDVASPSLQTISWRQF